MKNDFQIRLLALTKDAQEAIEILIKDRGRVELFSMADIENIENPKIDIFAYPDFPNYDADGPLEYAAIREVWIDEENIYIWGILKRDNFPSSADIHLYDFDAASSVELADYLLKIFLPE